MGYSLLTDPRAFHYVYTYIYADLAVDVSSWLLYATSNNLYNIR